MPEKMFKHKQVHWEAMEGWGWEVGGIGRGRSAGGGGWVAAKGESDANVCTAIE